MPKAMLEVLAYFELPDGFGGTRSDALRLMAAYLEDPTRPTPRSYTLSGADHADLRPGLAVLWKSRERANARGVKANGVIRLLSLDDAYEAWDERPEART